MNEKIHKIYEETSFIGKDPPQKSEKNVVHRKIIGGLRSEKGKEIHETIMTLLTTWKQQQELDPYKEMIKATKC